MSCPDALNTRMLKNIFVTNGSIFSIDVHEYSTHKGCIFIALRCGSKTVQKNPSSGSVSGHWFSPEGLNFVGVNC